MAAVAVKNRTFVAATAATLKAQERCGRNAERCGRNAERCGRNKEH
jgi:hypothetical protein